MQVFQLRRIRGPAAIVQGNIPGYKANHGRFGVTAQFQLNLINAGLILRGEIYHGVGQNRVGL